MGLVSRFKPKLRATEVNQKKIHDLFAPTRSGRRREKKSFEGRGKERLRKDQEEDYRLSRRASLNKLLSSAPTARRNTALTKMSWSRVTPLDGGEEVERKGEKMQKEGKSTQDPKIIDE